jgi:hypothetical protein
VQGAANVPHPAATAPQANGARIVEESGSGRGAQTALEGRSPAQTTVFIGFFCDIADGTARAFKCQCAPSERNRVQPEKLPPDDSDFRRGLRHSLLSYWMKHPEAKDTAAGVRLWWFGEGAGLSETILQEELEDLVRRGWAIGRGPGDLNRVYALNKAQIGTVERFLLESPGRIAAEEST